MNSKLLALGLLSVAAAFAAQKPAHAFYPRHDWLARHYCIQPQYNAFTPCCSCDPCGGGRCWSQFGFTHGGHGHGGHGYGHYHSDYLCRWNTLYRHQWPGQVFLDRIFCPKCWGHKPKCEDAPPCCDEAGCSLSPASIAPATTMPATPVAPAVPAAPLKLAPPAQTSLPPAYGVYNVGYTPYYYAPQPMGYPMPYMPAPYYPVYGPVGYYPMPYMMPMAAPGYGY